jgi:hypothetical protein
MHASRNSRPSIMTLRKAFLSAGKLSVPVLAVGGERSFGATMAAVMCFTASDLEEEAIRGSARHWHPHSPRFAEIWIASLAPRHRAAYDFAWRSRQHP